MGLTEEKLKELPQEQLLAVEKSISDEIQRRMAMGSMGSDEDKKVELAKKVKGDFDETTSVIQETKQFLFKNCDLDLTDAPSLTTVNKKEKNYY